jgi:hypothetical protein
MSQAQQEPRHGLKRTHANMTQRKTILHRMATSGARGANENALKQAARLGVNMDTDNAWDDADAEPEHKVWGPCLRRDNIYQCCPQPNLHGMDEGMTAKTNSGVLEATIKEAHTRFGFKATKVGP